MRAFLLNVFPSSTRQYSAQMVHVSSKYGYQSVIEYATVTNIGINTRQQENEIFQMIKAFFLLPNLNEHGTV